MRLAFSLLTVFVFISCGKQNKNERHDIEENYIDYVLDGASHKVIFDDSGIEIAELYKEIEIGLESENEQYVFGDIKKIELYQNNLYVLDADDQSLKIFDYPSGDHISTYNLEGRGPGEILYPEDMYIDNDSSIFLLDRQGKIVKYKIIESQIIHTEDYLLEDTPESFCYLGDFVIVINRLTFHGVDDSEVANISVYDKNTMKKIQQTGRVFLSDNWLLNDQLSRGFIDCTNTLDKVYAVYRYIPAIFSYSYPNFENTGSSIYLSGLDLIRVVPSFNSTMQPVIAYDRENGSAIVRNIISHNTGIFIQLYELLQSGEENFFTYYLSELDNELTVMNEYQDIGLIHQVTDSLIVASTNDPYPQIQIYKY